MTSTKTPPSEMERSFLMQGKDGKTVADLTVGLWPLSLSAEELSQLLDADEIGALLFWDVSRVGLTTPPPARRGLRRHGDAAN